MRAEAWGIPMRKTCTCASAYCAHHQAMRAQWVAAVATGLVDCWRCGDRLKPGQDFDLGHDDKDRHVYRGPECLRCNRSTSTRRKARRRWTL